jgi:hypothetical protein
LQEQTNFKYFHHNIISPSRCKQRLGIILHLIIPLPTGNARFVILEQSEGLDNLNRTLYWWFTWFN